MSKQPAIAKITRPRLSNVLQRPRLFRLLDRCRKTPVTWISGPAGSGKTTLVASYLDARKIPCLWYQIDGGDVDLSTFFYYLGLAAKKAAPRFRKPLPLLTPEYLMDVPTFSRRYFENLCTRIKPPFYIIFDNYQDVPHDFPFHAALASGIAAMPEGVHIVCLSRTEPPPTFSGLIAGNKMELIGWDELRLSPDESRAFVGLLSKDKQDRKTLEWMYDRTQGWAAGLVLLARAAKAHIIDPGKTEAPPENIFDYFATELFARADGKVRDFLIRTSVLPTMSPSIAEQLTGDNDAGQILEGLSRRNYFTYKTRKPGITYQYHPLFREFLQMQMKKSLDQEGITGVQQRAAKLLEESGQTEDAAGLYIEIKDWPTLIGLILKRAPQLNSQGRSATLEHWISALPGEMIDQVPWLLFWLGVCRVRVSFTESRRFFERALQQFDSSGDMTGALYAWSGVVEAIMYEFVDFTQLEKWIGWFNRFINARAPFPSVEVEYRAVTSMIVLSLFSGRDTHDIATWVDRANRLMYECPDRNMRIQSSIYLALYYMWTGDLEKLEGLVRDQKRWSQASEITPLSRMVASFTESNYHWIGAFPDFGVDAATAGLEASAARGVHTIDVHLIVMQLQGELNRNDLARAEELLAILESKASDPMTTQMIRYPHYLLPWYLLLKEDFIAACRQSEESLKILDEIGNLASHHAFISTAAAHALMILGRHPEAQQHIAVVRRIAKELNSPLMEFTGLLLEAQFLLSGPNAITEAPQLHASQTEDRERRVHGEEQSGLATLRTALALGRDRGYQNTLAWYAPAVARLCVTALEHGIETEYVKDLIRKHNLIPEPSTLHVENWPWPIRIATLGRFELLKDDKPVQFSGKVQKKPMELLKVLVALGGKDVAESQIMDALWPDAEGDAAQVSFRTTLHRLRKLLGHDDAIRLRGSQLSVNEGYCRVDAWAFGRMFDEALRKEDLKQQRLQSTIEKALALYQGHFLPADAREPWAMSMREHMRSRFLQLTLALGRHWEESKQYEKAVECYRQGLKTDSLAEEFYQSLMVCHAKRGQQSEAVKVYHLCCAMLVKALGIAPSAKTKELYASLLNNQ